MASSGKLQPRDPITDPGYRAHHAAHELGHAKDYENYDSFTRKVVRWGAPFLGALTALGGEELHKPALTALGAMTMAAPKLLDEYAASRNAMAALREKGQLSEEQLRKERKTLMLAGGTYLLPAAIISGLSALHSHFTSIDPNLKIPHLSRMAMGYVAGELVGNAFRKRSKEGKVLTPAETEGLRQLMNVSAKIYPSSDEIAWGDNAAYQPKGTGIFPNRRQRNIEKLLAPSSNTKNDVREIMRQGGVILPQYELKKKAARNWSTLASELVV